METNLGWIVLALPLAGALILSLWPGEPPKAVTRAVGVGSVFLAFVLTAVVFAGMLGDDPSSRSHVDGLWEWITVGDLRVDLAIQIDPLSVLMMLVITGVGFLIHLYSTEYMAHSAGYRRFFAEMNFFVFSMLLLVQAANFVFLIVGWAFVGLASYLLIGFDYDRPAAVAAAKKAFVINVIGDVGMVIAAWLIMREVGSLDYGAVLSAAPGAFGDSGVADAVALLLFVGAAAKSAQVPLHTWLPDAMEGPTPVSALIHAATMVTAGVYLVVRTHALYEIAPVAGDVVAVVGGVTLLMAATIAVAQVDIKRVLAWSTVSQIGYMIMGAGLGAYAGAMFHFLTHAFFKALLFLAAGIVIHALAGEQSMDRMGGLNRYLRFAYFAIAVGCLAIAGIPGLSGFFSKDEILAVALEAGTLGIVLWVMGTVAAALTAFYMFRLLFRTFHATEPEGGYAHTPHPSGWAMNVPVAILAVLAAIGGWLQVPGGWHAISDWLAPVLADVPEPLEATTRGEWITSLVTSGLALVAIGAAWKIFGRDDTRRRALARRFAGPRPVLEEAYLFDEVYEQTVVQPGRDLADAMLTGVEPRGVQGIVVAAATTVRDAAVGMRALQTGLVRTYVFAVAAGAVVVAVVIALVR
ncbi:MAG: NADH-quinone oxidoreductase subunit L [Actinomycetota bacterium]